jgi:hypothetical protein
MSKYLWRYDVWIGSARLETKEAAMSRVYVVFVRSREEMMKVGRGMLLGCERKDSGLQRNDGRRSRVSVKEGERIE